MNIAFPSARHQTGRIDRHPVGLMVVIGLHVLLAGALLSARMIAPTTPEPQAVTVLPDPIAPPPVVKSTQLPPPTARAPVIYVDPTMDIVVDPDQPRVTTSNDRPADVVARQPAAADEKVASVASTLRVQPRAASVSAGAAQCRPEYPPAAARASATGTSRIRFTIDAAGRVTGAQILQPSGATREHRLLDQAAIAALAQCPITAGTDDLGRAVGSTADVEYVWTLN